MGSNSSYFNSEAIYMYYVKAIIHTFYMEIQSILYVYNSMIPQYPDAFALSPADGDMP